MIFEKPVLASVRAKEMNETDLVIEFLPSYPDLLSSD